jgi:hypothetical protein
MTSRLGLWYPEKPSPAGLPRLGLWNPRSHGDSDRRYPLPSVRRPRRLGTLVPPTILSGIAHRPARLGVGFSSRRRGLSHEHPARTATRTLVPPRFPERRGAITCCEGAHRPHATWIFRSYPPLSTGLWNPLQPDYETSTGRLRTPAPPLSDSSTPHLRLSTGLWAPHSNSRIK